MLQSACDHPFLNATDCKIETAIRANNQVIARNEIANNQQFNDRIDQQNQQIQNLKSEVQSLTDQLDKIKTQNDNQLSQLKSQTTQLETTTSQTSNQINNYEIVGITIAACILLALAIRAFKKRFTIVKSKAASA